MLGQWYEIRFNMTQRNYASCNWSLQQCRGIIRILLKFTIVLSVKIYKHLFWTKGCKNTSLIGENRWGSQSRSWGVKGKRIPAQIFHSSKYIKTPPDKIKVGSTLEEPNPMFWGTIWNIWNVEFRWSNVEAIIVRNEANYWGLMLS